jgi:6-phosphofructokinase 1
MKHIGVLTSGGDAPGMNAAIRAVVRAAVFHNIRVSGIYRGFEGLIEGEIQPLHARSVGNIIQRGGTMLKSARSEAFRTAEGRRKAIAELQQQQIDGLIIIGGDGSFRGAEVLSAEYPIPIIGIPGTIDNDLGGTDFTIGYDTACNTVIHAVDAIRDTASSHNRIFFIEAMGRDSGFIALRAGVAAGIETIIIPEREEEWKQLLEKLQRGQRVKKSAALVMVGEGCHCGNATTLAKQFSDSFPDLEVRVTILGHVQRGGSPSCFDRELASRLGVSAVEGLLKGEKNKMVGLMQQQIHFTPFHQLAEKRKSIDTELLRLQEILTV